MIWKSAKNVKLINASMYFDTGDVRHIWPYPIYRKRYAEKFNREFSELFGDKSNMQVLERDLFRVKLHNLAFNFLPSLHETLRLSLTIDNKKILARARELYQEFFGSEFNSTKDLKRISKEAERMQRKYRSLTVEQEAPKDKFDFETIIAMVEVLLSVSIDRSLRLFQFMPYWKMAQKKSNG